MSMFEPDKPTYSAFWVFQAFCVGMMVSALAIAALNDKKSITPQECQTLCSELGVVSFEENTRTTTCLCVEDYPWE